MTPSVESNPSKQTCSVKGMNQALQNDTLIVKGSVGKAAHNYWSVKSGSAGNQASETHRSHDLRKELQIH
jgi:hypothetical protein